MSPWEGQRPACAHCGKRPRLLAKGYCENSCYRRWIRAGRPEEGPPPDRLEWWRQMPIASDRISNNMDVGIAGEYLVCADLLLSGYPAFRTDQGCVYDVALDLDGRFLRLQVKSTREINRTPLRVPAYEWNVKRTSARGGKYNYAEGDFDVLALVALDIRRVAYMVPAPDRGTVRIRPPGSSGGEQFTDYPIGRVIAHFIAPRPDVRQWAAGEREEG